MLRKIVLAAALLAPLSACQNPDGSTDYLRSAAGGALAGVAGGALNDVFNSQRGGPRYGYPQRGGPGGPAWTRRF